VKNYSGGMKRRLEIARGLIHAPSVLLFDEPTLGLDPQTRRSIWEYIFRLNQQKNITILITTHYMEEADELCDRIAIIDHGRLVAQGTSDELKSQLQGDSIQLEFSTKEDAMKMKKRVKTLPFVKQVKFIKSNGKMPGPPAGMMKQMMKRMKKMKTMPKNRARMQQSDEFKISLIVENGGTQITQLVEIAKDEGVEIKSVQMNKPTLEDVFLHHTGRKIRVEASNKMNFMKQMMMMRGRR